MESLKNNGAMVKINPVERTELIIEDKQLGDKQRVFVVD
jgi:hypothetical protein